MGPGGEQVGVVRVEDALRLAEEAGLDLVEVDLDKVVIGIGSFQP